MTCFLEPQFLELPKKTFFKNHVTLLKLKPHRLFLKLFYSWGTWDKKNMADSVQYTSM